MPANMIDFEDFVRVSPQCIFLDEGLPFDVFAIVEGSRVPVLYAAKGKTAPPLDSNDPSSASIGLFAFSTLKTTVVRSVTVARC